MFLLPFGYWGCLRHVGIPSCRFSPQEAAQTGRASITSCSPDSVNPCVILTPPLRVRSPPSLAPCRLAGQTQQAGRHRAGATLPNRAAVIISIPLVFVIVSNRTSGGSQAESMAESRTLRSSARSRPWCNRCRTISGRQAMAHSTSHVGTGNMFVSFPEPDSLGGVPEPHTGGL